MRQQKKNTEETKETSTTNKNLLVQPPGAGVSGGGGGNGFLARLGKVPKPTFLREPLALGANKNMHITLRKLDENKTQHATNTTNSNLLTRFFPGRRIGLTSLRLTVTVFGLHSVKTHR